MGLNILEREELRHSENVEVLFDLDTLTLVGRYKDELSAHRAKKAWLKTLQDCFLLDNESDIDLRVRAAPTQQHYLLICEFLSSCARYAFWRLTNNHVPEAAYLLETGHLPNSKNQSYISAPDMKAIIDREMSTFDKQVEEQKSLFKKIGDLTKNFVRSL